MGPFYEGNDGTAIYNTNFRPFTSPVPFLLMRRAVISDWKFFLNNEDWLRLWGVVMERPQSKLLLTNYVASRGAQGATNSREADDPTSGCGRSIHRRQADGEALHRTCLAFPRLKAVTKWRASRRIRCPRCKSICRPPNLWRAASQFNNSRSTDPSAREFKKLKWRQMSPQPSWTMCR
jgi:hypothetical protein